MNRLLLSGLTSLTLLLGVTEAAQTTFINPAGSTFNFINNGTTTTPQIDAVNFINNGTFNADTTGFSGLPFETADTLNYTNTGSMSGDSGWLFDLSPASVGSRRSAANFFNDNLASVTGVNFLLVSATNIYNSGLFTVGVDGLIQLDGGAINLAQSQMLTGTAPGSARGSSYAVLTNQFDPDLFISDIYWAATSTVPNTPIPSLDTASFWRPVVTASSVTTNVTRIGTILPGGIMVAPFTNIVTVTTNAASTNIVAQAPSIPSPPAEPTFISGFSLSNPSLNSWTNNGSNDPIADSTNVNRIITTLVLTNWTGTPNSVPNNVVTNYVGQAITLNPNAPGFNLITNLTRQAVFVKKPNDTNFRVQTGYMGATNAMGDTVGVLISMPVTNLVSLQVSTNYIFFQDTLASQTTRGLLGNSENSPPSTFRPTNYLVERTAGGFPGNFRAGIGPPPLDFFSTSGNLELLSGRANSNLQANLSYDFVTNPTVTAGDISAYSALIDTVLRPAAVPGGTFTNLLGSIKITAKKLDLSRARMSANGALLIKADDVILSNTVIDCEYLSFDIGSTSGDLGVTNLANAQVTGRVRGSIEAFSALWTNTVNLIFTNNWTFNTAPAPDGSNTLVTPVPNPFTNQVFITYHVLMLNAADLGSVFPVIVYDFVLHGNRITVNDYVSVIESLLLDGRTLTVNAGGAIDIVGSYPSTDPNTGAQAVQNWIFTNAPNLLYFTNNGYVYIPNEAHFGDDRGLPYLDFVNTGSGTLTAGSVQVRSVYFENDGTLTTTTGPLILQCGAAKLLGYGTNNNYVGYDYGQSTSAGLSQITADTLVLSNHVLSSGDSLSLTVTNRLDGGVTNRPDGNPLNIVQVQNGFNLLVKPKTGDLLGSTFISTVPTATDKTMVHLWAGENRGPTPAGYVNNAAIGVLQLSATNTASIFRFTGTGAPGTTNALYVDQLDLSLFGPRLGLKQFQIDPNMVIYYATLKLPTGTILPVNGLNDYFAPGTLVWVPSYAGPNSSVTVTNPATGQLVSVNSDLRNSATIDSNGDGTPNFFDPYPFNFAPFQMTVNGNGAVIPNYTNGQLLIVGQTYALIAQPAAGAKFLGWTGSISNSSPQLTFVMTNGLSFVANFTFPTKASYNGLFFETNAVELGKSGAIAVTVTKKGKFSGSLRICQLGAGGARRYAFSGQLNSGEPNNLSAGPYQLQLLLSEDQITGTVSGTVSNTAWSADLVLNRSVFDARTNTAPFAGKYTIVFPGSEDPTDTQNPQGDGYGAVTVDKLGNVRMNGALGDGTAISQSAAVSADGLWPLFVPLYQGNGQILSWQTFAIDGQVGGPYSWIKEPNKKAGRFRGGFVWETNTIGSMYDPTAKPITMITDGTLLLQGANLSEPVTKEVTIGTNNKTANAKPGQFSLTFKPASGLFTGRVVNPNTHKPINFSGAVLQNQGVGLGYFLTTNLSGQVSIGP
jgi:hypothetical protein